VKRWNGAAWETFAGALPGDTSASGAGISGTSFGDSMYPAIAIDHLDNPVVAWPSMLDGAYAVNVARWTGAVWNFLTPFQVSTGPWLPGERPLAMTLGRDDQPFVAFVQADNEYGSEINVVHWNAMTAKWNWFKSADGIEGGAGVQEYGTSEKPSIAVDGRGHPIVAWEKVLIDKSGSEIYVLRWDGSAWIQLAGSASGGGISNTPSWSSAPSIAAARVPGNGNDFLYAAVAWSDYDKASNQYEIYFKQWNGAAWVEVAGGLPGQTSAADGGISGTPRDSQWASLRLDANKRPMVSWMEVQAPANSDIYLKHWTGAKWTALGDSATVGGINKTGTVNWSGTSLAVRPGELYTVSWADTSPGQAEAYLRAWYPIVIQWPLGVPILIDAVTGFPIEPGATLSGDAIAILDHFDTRGERAMGSLQVEVRPFGWAYAGESSGESAFVSSGEDARVLVQELLPGEYSMRVRIVNEDGEASPWIEVGDDADRPDFVVRSR
jgi:hypothetical protein